MSQNPLNLTQYPESPIRRRNNTYMNPKMSLSPRLSVEESHSLVVNTFGKLNTIVAFLDTLIQNRLNSQEAQMINIMKVQIEKMQNDIDSIVEKYNQMIRSKDRDTVLYQTRIQLEFYKTEGLRLHLETQTLRQEIKKLKAQIKETKYQLENVEMTTKNLGKKYYRLKLKTQQAQQQKPKDQSNILKKDRYRSLSRQRSSVLKQNGKQETSKGIFKTPASTHIMDYQSGMGSNHWLGSKIKKIKRACSIYRQDLTFENKSYHEKKRETINKRQTTGRIFVVSDL